MVRDRVRVRVRVRVEEVEPPHHLREAERGEVCLDVVVREVACGQG